MIFLKDNQRGFTLIELLVVMAVVTALATVVFSISSTSRGKARDVERKATLRQLQVYLELYKNNTGAYPSSGGTWYSSEPSDGVPNNSGNWIPGLAPGYIGRLPRDPLGGDSTNPVCAGGWKRAYLYYSDGNDYALLAHCSPEGTMTTSDPFYDYVRTTWAWKACSRVGCVW